MALLKPIFPKDSFYKRRTASVTAPSVWRFPPWPHRELTLSQTLRRDGAEDPGLVAAPLRRLPALLRQLPVFGAAQISGDDLDHGRKHVMTSSGQISCYYRPQRRQGFCCETVTS